MVRLRFHNAVATLLIAIFVFNFCSRASAAGVGYSEAQLTEKRKEHARIVAILSSIVDGLIGGGNREIPQSLPPSPRPAPPPSSPSPRPLSPSPRPPSPSPKPSSPSPRPAVPSKSPSPSPEETVEEAPSKPGATKISGVPYAVFDYEAPSGKADNAVIMLHDVDGEAKDMIPIMDAIRKEMFPNTRFVMPEANQLYLTSLKADANSWFDPSDSSTDGSAGKNAQLKVVSYIEKIGNHLVEQGIGRDKIVIIGYGQGSTVALTTYLRHEWGGVLGIAGSLSMADSYPAEMSEDSSLAPGVLVAGEQDTKVQVDAMRTSAAKFEELGRDLTYMEIEGEGHDIISNERIPALATGLLNRVIAIY